MLYGTLFCSGNTFSYYSIGLAGLFIGLGEILGKMFLGNKVQMLRALDFTYVERDMYILYKKRKWKRVSYNVIPVYLALGYCVVGSCLSLAHMHSEGYTYLLVSRCLATKFSKAYFRLWEYGCGLLESSLNIKGDERLANKIVMHLMHPN